MTIKPLHDYVLVDLMDDPYGVSAQSEKIARRGTVAAVGPGTGLEIESKEAHRLPDGTVSRMCVKVGDTVVVEPYLGTTVYENAKQYLLIREEAIMAVVEEVTTK